MNTHTHTRTQGGIFLKWPWARRGSRCTYLCTRPSYTNHHATLPSSASCSRYVFVFVCVSLIVCSR